MRNGNGSLRSRLPKPQGFTSVYAPAIRKRVKLVGSHAWFRFILRCPKERRVLGEEFKADSRYVAGLLTRMIRSAVLKETNGNGSPKRSKVLVDQRTGLQFLVSNGRRKPYLKSVFREDMVVH